MGEKPFAKIQAFVSTVVSRAKTAASIGKTFNGRRDVYAALGYPRTIDLHEFRERYRRNGIAKRIVAAYPQATWRNRPVVTEVGKLPEDSDFAKKFKALATRIRLFHHLERVDKLAGIGYYGVLLVGLRASGQVGDPVTKKKRDITDILYLTSFLQESAAVHSFDIDPTSPRFGLPQIYGINLSGNAQSDSIFPLRVVTGNTKVHYSRVFHIAEDLGEDEVLGIPRLEAVWNYLDDLDKIMGGSAEAFWRVIDRGIQFDIDKDVTLSEEDEADFADEIEEYMHGYKRYLRTKGITANVLGSDAPDPSKAVDTVVSLIAGTTGIPKRILTGSEVGQLASTQDDKNFNARVSERQTSFAEPQMLRPFIDRMIDYGVLPKAEYEIHWPDLSTLTDKEKADVSARRSQSFKNVAAEEPRLLTTGEKREIFFDLPREIPEEENNLTPPVSLAPPQEPRANQEFTFQLPATEITVPSLKAPDINVHTAPVTVEVAVPPPVINVEAPDIIIPPAEIKVEPSTAEAPVINVDVQAAKAPDVTVRNQVETPGVTVAAPDVKIIVDVPVPKVTINNEVKVDVPAPEVEIIVEKSDGAHVDFERDGQGRVTSADITEKD